MTSGTMTELMGEDIDQRGFELLCVGMAKFSLRQLLQAVVHQPGMVERRLQDQRLPKRYGGPMAAMERTRPQDAGLVAMYALVAAEGAGDRAAV